MRHRSKTLSLGASLLSALLIVPASRALAEWPQGGAWDAPEMGRCFATAKDFVRAAFGPASVEDENIRISAAEPPVKGGTWVVDQTPTTNYAWYLLETGAERTLCVTLFVPIAAQVDLARNGEELIARSKTQASPGFPQKQVEFRKPAGAGTFTPVSCREIKANRAGSTSSRKVPCATLFDD